MVEGAAPRSRSARSRSDRRPRGSLRSREVHEAEPAPAKAGARMAMRQFGSVEIPQEAFIKALKMEKD